jgi:hypothetical protein
MEELPNSQTLQRLPMKILLQKVIHPSQETDSKGEEPFKGQTAKCLSDASQKSPMSNLLEGDLSNFLLTPRSLWSSTGLVVVVSQDAFLLCSSLLPYLGRDCYFIYLSTGGCAGFSHTPRKFHGIPWPSIAFPSETSRNFHGILSTSCSRR